MKKGFLREVLDDIAQGKDLVSIFMGLGRSPARVWEALNFLASQGDHLLLEKVASRYRVDSSYLLHRIQGLIRQVEEFKEEDPYTLLGVEYTASPSEIHSSWKRLMQEWHPDRKGGDPRAHEECRRINEAYELLKDRERRREYDRRHGPLLAVLRELRGIEPSFIGPDLRRRSWLLWAGVALMVMVLGGGLLIKGLHRERKGVPHFKMVFLPTRVEGGKGKVKGVREVPPVAKGGESLGTGKGEGKGLEKGVSTSSREKGNKGVSSPVALEAKKTEKSQMSPIPRSLSKPSKPQLTFLTGSKVKERHVSPSGRWGRKGIGEPKGGRPKEAVHLAGKPRVVKGHSPKPKGEKANREGKTKKLVALKDKKIEHREARVAKAGGLSLRNREDSGEVPTSDIGEEKMVKKEETGEGTLEAKGTGGASTRGILAGKGQTAEKEKPVFPSRVESRGASPFSVVERFMEAYRSEDLPALLSLFSKGAVENGKPVTEYVARYRQFFGSFRVLEYRLMESRVLGGGDRAKVEGAYLVSLIPKSGGNLRWIRGRVTWTLVREDRGWLINSLDYTIR